MEELPTSLIVSGLTGEGAQYNGTFVLNAEALPELPEPSWRESRPTNPPKPAAVWFTADQMREYALAAVAKERERCAKIADGYAADDWMGAEGARRVAAAIRGQT